MATLSNLERVKTIKQKVLHDRVAPEQLLEWIDPHATINSPANFEQATGAAALLAVMDYWTQAFPNVTSRWQNTQETPTGQVVVSWEAEAVHDGTAFFGVPAQNKPVTYSGTTTYHFNDQGKLIQYDVDIDLDAIKAQLR